MFDVPLALYLTIPTQIIRIYNIFQSSVDLYVKSVDRALKNQ